MNILILAAGDPIADGDNYPIWLTEIEGQLVIERQILQLAKLGESRFIVCVRADDNRNYHVNHIVEMIAPGAKVVEINRPTAGAACTALMAVGDLALEDELTVVSATDQIDIDFTEAVNGFRGRGADGGLMVFDSLHPRYSFVRFGEGDEIIEVVEKRPISRSANTGFYWFRRAGDFVDALQSMIIKDAHLNHVFYISPAINEMILKQKRVLGLKIAKESYHPLKSSKHVQHLELTLDGEVTR